MNMVKAACGHTVVAVGCPNSIARAESSKQCDDCKRAYCKASCGARVYVDDRRRYGGRSGTTYTWLTVECPDAEYGYLPVGDPWPCISPARAEVQASADLALASHRGDIAARTASIARYAELLKKKNARKAS